MAKLNHIKPKIRETKDSRLQSLRRNFWDAIKGTEQDFTKIRLGKAMFLLAIPMVLEMIMESIFAIVDIYFVGRLGAEAVATVGLTEAIITIVYSVAVGFATATTAIVSRRIGEKNREGASQAAFQAILTGIAASLIIAIPGAIYASDLLRLMGASDIIVEEYSTYTSIMLGGNIIIMLLFIMNAIFRSSGDAMISLRVLFYANALNIILDPLLIFGIGPFPELGITGAAIATNTGRGIGVLYQIYLLTRGNYRVKILKKHLKIKFDIIRQILDISAGGIMQHLIATSSWIFLVRIISSFGTDAVAGYTIGIRLIIFALLPSWGISNAAATLVGQNLGARKPDRAERAVWYSSRINLMIMGTIGLFFVLFPDVFVAPFIESGSSEGVLISARSSLRIISYGFLFYGVGMVVVQSFNGAGDTKTPTRINIISFWLIEIPVAYALAKFAGMEEQGVFVAIIIAESIMTLIGIYLFRKGKWKQVTL